MDRHLLTLVPTIPSPRGTYNTQALFVVDKRPSHPLAEEKGGDGDSEEFCNGGDGHGNGKPPAAAAATNGFATSEGVHLHGGTEGVDGASCCDMGGERRRVKERVFRSSSSSSSSCFFSSHPNSFSFSPFFLLPPLFSKLSNRKQGASAAPS